MNESHHPADVGGVRHNAAMPEHERSTRASTVRFLATADWQLGMTAHFLPEEARVRYQQDRLDAVVRLGELAAAEDCAFVVVAGDVFESNQLDRRVIARALTAMSQIHVPVFLLPGNHDPLDAASLYDSPEFVDRVPDHVHVLRQPGLYPIDDAAPGVDLVAAPWFSKRPLTDLVSDAIDLIDPDPERIRVLVGHGAVWSADSEALSAIDADRIAGAGEAGLINACILGDRHGLQQVNDWVWYPGTTEVTRRVEIDPGHALVVEAGDGPPQITAHRVGRWHFDVVSAHLNSSADIDDLERRLGDLPDPQRRAVWLRLEGSLTLVDADRLASVEAHAADVLALLQRWDRHTDLVTLPSDDELAALDLTGWAREAVNDLVTAGQRADTDDALVARDALALLYRLSRGAR